LRGKTTDFMRILGLSAFKHDTAAAVIEDGTIKAAIENDKLARSRTHGLPGAAVRACLERVGAGWDGIDTVALATRPLQSFARKSLLRLKLSLTTPISSTYHEAKEIGLLARELNDLRALRQRVRDPHQPVVSFDHHLCHAANAFFLSPFDRALIITMDEDGDGISATVGIGEGNHIRRVRTMAFPHSLAWVYSLTTALIGFLPHQDEHKTQWLSLAGEPLYKDVFLEMFRQPRTQELRLNRKFFNRRLAGRLAFSAEFYRRVGVTEGSRDIPEAVRQNLASSVQQAYAEILIELVGHLRETLGVKSVCLSGGLFLNSLLVTVLEDKFGIDQIFVPPAPGNAGTAVGAACLAWHHLLRKPRSEPPYSVMWGPKFGHQEVKEVLDNCKARYSLHNTEQRKIDATVELLDSGKVVGWYQGAAEFGSRSLGNRSVLASPWAPYVRENLNDFIKHREWFRPFAVAIPEEDCSRFFTASALCRFMNSLARVKPESNPLPQDFFLPGGLLRLHVVERRSNPLFWKLLKRFGERAPAPMLLNTSFNLFGEPLVLTARDALRSYSCSGLDALIIDNFLLSKTNTHGQFSTRAMNEKRVPLGA
jgi:carbamoyltransferase